MRLNGTEKHICTCPVCGAKHAKLGTTAQGDRQHQAFTELEALRKGLERRGLEMLQLYLGGLKAAEIAKRYGTGASAAGAAIDAAAGLVRPDMEWLERLDAVRRRDLTAFDTAAIIESIERLKA